MYINNKESLNIVFFIILFIFLVYIYSKPYLLKCNTNDNNNEHFQSQIANTETPDIRGIKIELFRIIYELIPLYTKNIDFNNSLLPFFNENINTTRKNIVKKLILNKINNEPIIDIYSLILNNYSECYNKLITYNESDSNNQLNILLKNIIDTKKKIYFNLKYSTDSTNSINNDNTIVGNKNNSLKDILDGLNTSLQEQFLDNPITSTGSVSSSVSRSIIVPDTDFNIKPQILKLINVYRVITNKNDILFMNLKQKYNILIDYCKNIINDINLTKVIVLLRNIDIYIYNINSVFDPFKFLIEYLNISLSNTKKTLTKIDINKHSKYYLDYNKSINKIKDLLTFKTSNSPIDILSNAQSMSNNLSLFCSKYRALNKPSEDKLILDKILKMKKEKKENQINTLTNNINKLQKDLLFDDIDKYNSYKLRTNNDSKKMMEGIVKAKKNIDNSDNIKINLK